MCRCGFGRRKFRSDAPRGRDCREDAVFYGCLSPKLDAGDRLIDFAALYAELPSAIRKQDRFACLLEARVRHGERCIVVGPGWPLEIGIEAQHEPLRRVGTATPVHPCIAIHREDFPARVLLEPGGDGGDVDEAIRRRPDLAKSPIEICWRQVPELQSQRRGRIAPEHQLSVERRGQIDAPRRVDPDGRGDERLLQRLRHDRHQVGVFSHEWEPRNVGRRDDVLQIPIARPCPVQPMGLSVYRCARDHVVERTDHRQPIFQGTAEQAADGDRIRRDIKAAKQCDQQRCLGLAVTESARPGEISVRWHHAAFVHAKEHVPHLILDQPQRRCGTRGRIRRRRLDVRDFPMKRRVRRKRCRRLRQWSQSFGDVRPRSEVGEFDAAVDERTKGAPFGCVSGWRSCRSIDNSVTP